MADWSEKERNAINEAYRKRAVDEPLTEDDIKLMIAFEVSNALASDEHKAKIAAIKAQNELELKQSREQAAKAMETLETLAAEAQAKLKAANEQLKIIYDERKRVDNGQIEK